MRKVENPPLCLVYNDMNIEIQYGCISGSTDTLIQHQPFIGKVIGLLLSIGMFNLVYHPFLHMVLLHMNVTTLALSIVYDLYQRVPHVQNVPIPILVLCSLNLSCVSGRLRKDVQLPGTTRRPMVDAHSDKSMGQGDTTSPLLYTEIFPDIKYHHDSSQCPL